MIQDNPAISIPFSIPMHGTSSELVDSAEILEQVMASLGEDYPELCVSWAQLPKNR
jgi:hypothetical protein